MPTCWMGQLFSTSFATMARDGPSSRPMDDVFIDFKAGQEQAELEVKRLCQRVLQGWGRVAVEEMQVGRALDVCPSLTDRHLEQAPRMPLRRSPRCRAASQTCS